MEKSQELIPGAQIPTQTLTGENERRYVRRLVRTFRAARLNDYYPDGRALGSHVQTLSPEVHQGLYDGVQVDLRSGLPSYREWTRAQTDVRIAGDQIRQLGDPDELGEKARQDGEDSIYARQLAKYRYYSEIREHELIPLGDMKVALRRIETETNTGHFHVVLDKLDASGLFVRYSIDLSQRSDFWSDRMVEVDDREVAEQSEEFRSLIYRFTSLDAEFTFVKLTTMSGLAVERVVKGVVGPFFYPWTPDAPDDVVGVVGDDGFVATFGLDMAAPDVKEPRNNDPFSDLVRSDLSKEAAEGYDQAREAYDYRVFKDRKFVAPRRARGAVQKLCEGRGTKNIVYTI